MTFLQIRFLASGVLLTFLSTFGQTFYISLFGRQIQQEFGLSHGGFGSIYSAGTLLSALCLIWVGKLADHIPMSRLGAATMLGLALFSAGLATASQPWMLLVCVFGLRLCGQGMMVHLAMTAMSRWFLRFRGRALSVAGLGLPASETVLPVAAVALTASIGWRPTWYLAAGLLVLLAPFLVLLLRGEPEPGFDKSGGEAETADAPADWSQSRVLRDPLFLGLMPGLLAMPFIVTGLFFHQVVLVELKGWSLAHYAASFPAYAAGTVLTSLLAGWAVDRFGSIALLRFFLFPMALGLLALDRIDGLVAAPIFMILTGITVGSTGTLFGALWADLYGTRHIGAIRALVMSLGVAASALAPGLIGVLMDFGLPLSIQIRAMLVYLLLCIVLAFALHGPLSSRIHGRPAASPS